MLIKICVRKIYAQKLAYELSWIASWFGVPICVIIPNAVQIGQTVAEIIIELLGCRPTPSWISLDLKFVTDQTVTRAELRHRVKFRGDCHWSNCCRDISILAFFGCSHNLGFLKLYIFNDPNGQEKRSASLCQYYVEIAQTTEEMCQFSIFQDGGRRHLGFLTFQIFNGQGGQEVRSASSSQISSKSLESRLR